MPSVALVSPLWPSVWLPLPKWNCFQSSILSDVAALASTRLKSFFVLSHPYRRFASATGSSTSTARKPRIFTLTMRSCIRTLKGIPFKCIENINASELVIYLYRLPHLIFPFPLIKSSAFINSLTQTISKRFKLLIDHQNLDANLLFLRSEIKRI